MGHYLLSEMASKARPRALCEGFYRASYPRLGCWLVQSRMPELFIAYLKGKKSFRCGFGIFQRVTIEEKTLRC